MTTVLNQNFISSNKEDKYGDDEKFEPWADNNIYFPIATKLIDPLYNLGFTPNMITIISTLFTISCIYFLHINKPNIAALVYSVGYLLDAIDGRMARKYSMGSTIGMALDLVSDNVSNFIILIYFLYYYEMNNSTILVLFFMIIATIVLLLSYGINEAIDSYNKTNSDDFYERRVKELAKINNGKTMFEKLLYRLFLIVTKSSYDLYRNYFPTFNKECIFSRLSILKHFGPGNFCLLASIMLYNSNKFLVRK